MTLYQVMHVTCCVVACGCQATDNFISCRAAFESGVKLDGTGLIQVSIAIYPPQHFSTLCTKQLYVL